MITFIGVIALLVAVTIFLIVLAASTGSTEFHADERRQLELERAEARLQPTGAVRLSGEPMPELAQAQPAPEAAAPLTPQQIYQNNCSSCHATGVLGAPRSGNEGDWAPRLQEKGIEGLVQNAINGIGSMPARGGNARLSDEEIDATVRYMLEQSGLQP